MVNTVLDTQSHTLANAIEVDGALLGFFVDCVDADLPVGRSTVDVDTTCQW